MEQKDLSFKDISEFKKGDIVTALIPKVIVRGMTSEERKEAPDNLVKTIFIVRKVFPNYGKYGFILCHAYISNFELSLCGVVNPSYYHLRYSTDKEKECLFSALAKVGQHWNPIKKQVENENGIKVGQEGNEVPWRYETIRFKLKEFYK